MVFKIIKFKKKNSILSLIKKKRVFNLKIITIFHHVLKYEFLKYEFNLKKSMQVPINGSIIMVKNLLKTI